MAGHTARALRLGGLVKETVLRDLAVRRIHRADAALSRVPDRAAVRFTANPPVFERILPARDVPMQSNARYTSSLHLALLDTLTTLGVGYLESVGAGAASPTIGIRDREWRRAIDALLRAHAGAMIGPDAGLPAASTATFVDKSGALEPTLHASAAQLLVPAVVRHRGEVVKRFGFDSAIRLEKWVEGEPGRDWAPKRWNPMTASVTDEDFIEERLPRREAPDSAGSEFAAAHLMETTFPIDAVYTWVDGTDPAWLERKRKALENSTGEPMPEDAAADLRFVGHDELRYSLRALEQYAPWIRHVYVVTDGQRPEWLREDSDWVSVVDHRQIAPPGTSLPTFNSQAIEANIHRIEGLSEHFLYFNDDMFLSSPVEPDLFFHANGLASIYLSRAQVAPGEPVEGEPAPDAAGKNARRLVEEVCGRRLSRKLFHAPYALRRSVSHEIEKRWPEIVQRTRDSQFRRLEDITLAGGLHLNYAYATARAVTRKIRYRYVGIGEHTAAGELDRLIADRHTLQTFCLNDAVQELPPEVADRQVRSFLARRFPDMGSFEKITP